MSFWIELDRWMQESNDPILQGPTKTLRGVEISDPDENSSLEPVTIVE
jgi:hypothetical protein